MGKQRVFVTVIVVSTIFALANSIAFFIGVFSTPPGTVYLGTVHYWEDYFFYLNHFYQGAHGAWLTVNRFTPEVTRPTVIYWSNILAGKFWSIFGLSDILAYNVTLIILAFTALITSFLLIRHVLKKSPQLILPAFLMATFATSLQNRVRSSSGTMIFWPFQIWKTPHFAFDRLGGAPHQIVLTIFTYIAFLAYYHRPSPTAPAGTGRKLTQLLNLPVASYLSILLSITLLASIQPAQAVMVMAGITGAEVLTALFHRNLRSVDLPRLTVLTVGCALMSLYMLQLLNLEPQIQTKIWEASQHSYTTFSFLLLSLGPVAWLGVIGIFSRLKQLSKPEIAGALIIAVGYAMFMSPVPKQIGISNVRLLFPANYVFWGIFAAYGAQYIAQRLAGITKIRPKTGLVVLTVLFILVSLPTLVWEIGQRLPKPQDTNDPLVYLPQPVRDGFGVLEHTGGADDIVVAAPLSHMDSLVPALSGHTTYSGHMLATIDNAVKQAVANRFFTEQLDAQTARDWIDKEHIRYALFTRYDGDRAVFEARYPFLSRIFDNGSVAVYSIQ